MGTVLPFDPHQATSTGAGGYKSGRSSKRGTPEILSTASTRSGGTSSHCEIACMVMPRGSAKPAKPPTALMARSKASLASVMARRSSMALPKSQAMLHCVGKVQLYNIDMTLGKRIKAARIRLVPKLTQKAVGEAFGITAKAVSGWELGGAPERERMPKLARLLQVPLAWLCEGNGEPPPPDHFDVLIEDLLPHEVAHVRALAESFRQQRRQPGRRVK
jgi:transcriptional regulator with XRE-family HTH domain